MLDVVVCLGVFVAIVYVGDRVGRRVAALAAQPPEPISFPIAMYLIRGVKIRALCVTTPLAVLAVFLTGDERILAGIYSWLAMIHFFAAGKIENLARRADATTAVRGRRLLVMFAGRAPSLFVSRRMIAAARRKALPEARVT